MPSKLYRFFNNTGGLNLRSTDTSLDNNEAEEIDNLHLTGDGAWTTHDIGYRIINTTPMAVGATIRGMTTFNTPTGQQYLVAMAGSKLGTVGTGDGTLTTLSSSLNLTSEIVSFITFQGVLILLNKDNHPLTWDGQNTPRELAGWPPSIGGLSPGYPAFGEIYANRLVVAGDENNPSMVYISELENPENFSPSLAEGVSDASPGTIQISPGDGEKITGLKTLYLPVDSREILLIFKERSTYMLTGNSAETFTVEKLSSEFGAVSHHSIVTVGNDALFLSEEGVTAISTATVQGNLTTQFMSRKLQPQVGNLNRQLLSNAWAIHLRQRNEIWWGVTEAGSTENTRILVYNYGTGKGVWSRRSGISAACAEEFNGKLYTGGYNGFFSHQLVGSSYNGQPIDWVYRTPFYDFGSPRQRKRIREVELYCKQLASMDVTVKSAWDIRRNASAQQPRVLTTQPHQGSALYGTTSTYGDETYGLAGVNVVSMVPNGSGRQFQLEFSGSAADLPIELQGWTITTLLGGRY